MMTLEIFLQTLLVIISVCSAIYGMFKFLLKDILSKITLIDDHILDIKNENKRMDQRVTETNKRMDGIYHILIKKVE